MFRAWMAGFDWEYGLSWIVVGSS